MGKKEDPIVRFWAKVNKNGPIPLHAPELDNCWLWTAHLYNGYGKLKVETKMLSAHRFSYLLHKNELPSGDLDHLCRQRSCVNPAHLEPVTRLVNIQRSPIHNVSKTHCKNGHEFNELNTRFRANGRWRKCHECEVIASAKSYLKKRQTCFGV